MLNFQILIPQPIDIQKNEIIPFDFFTHGNLIPIWRDSYRLNLLNLITEFNELHFLSFNISFCNSFSNCINNFGLAIFLHES